MAYLFAEGTFSEWLLAQVPTADFNAIQLVLQFGALGILALIAWHIPRLIRELKEWRRESDSAHREERDSLKQERIEALKAYREEVRYERAECQKHFDHLAKINIEGHKTTQQSMANLGEAINQVGQAMVSHDQFAQAAIQKLTKPTPPDGIRSVPKKEGT